MDTDDIQPLTVTVEQAAKLLGIGRSTAYELVQAGDIPSLRLGRRIVVPSAYIARVAGLTHSTSPDTSATATGHRPAVPPRTESQYVDSHHSRER
jgi:excisionase family DNA binding protein